MIEKAWEAEFWRVMREALYEETMGPLPPDNPDTTVRCRRTFDHAQAASLRATGMSYANIGRQLGISDNTARAAVWRYRAAHRGKAA